MDSDDLENEASDSSQVSKPSIEDNFDNLKIHEKTRHGPLLPSRSFNLSQREVPGKSSSTGSSQLSAHGHSLGYHSHNYNQSNPMSSAAATNSNSGASGVSGPVSSGGSSSHLSSKPRGQPASRPDTGEGISSAYAAAPGLHRTNSLDTLFSLMARPRAAGPGAEAAKLKEIGVTKSTQTDFEDQTMGDGFGLPVASDVSWKKLQEYLLAGGAAGNHD